MLIKCKNPELYRMWIEYLCARNGVENSDATIRVTAFSYSQKGMIPYV